MSLANYAQVLMAARRPSIATPPFVPGNLPRGYPGSTATTIPAAASTPPGYPSEGPAPILLGGVQPQAEQPSGPLLPGMIGVRQSDISQPTPGPVAAPQPSQVPPSSGGFWSRLLAGIHNPANQAAMMAAGTAMTAPRQFGQSGWGQFNQALAGAYNAKNQYDLYQQYMKQSAAQQAFENQIKGREATVKEREAAVKESEAKTRGTVGQAQAGLYGAQAGAIPEETAIAKKKAETDASRVAAETAHWQNQDKTAQENIDHLTAVETRLNKALEESVRSNKADDATKRYQISVQDRLGTVRNQLYKEHLDQLMAHAVMQNEEGLRPVMIAAYNNAAKMMAADTSDEVMNMSPEAKAKKTEQIAIEAFNNMIQYIPKKNAGLEQKRQQDLANVEFKGVGAGVPPPIGTPGPPRTTGPNLPAPAEPVPGVAKLPAGIDTSNLPKFTKGNQTLVQYKGAFYSM